MAYQPLSFDDFRQQLLDEYRNKVPGADVSDDSEIYARASMGAAIGGLLMYGLRYIEDQVFPDSADTANLERHAGLYAITRKSATAAGAGKFELTGVDTTVVSSGLTLTHEDGTEFVTTSGGTITGGVLEVDLDAVTTGTVGNKVAGDELTVQSPPTGVDSTGDVTVDLDGGTDDETDAELAARVLERMRQGNAGGTHTDYEQWALAIDGVVQAHTLEQRRGPGTVSVAVYSVDVDGNREPANSALRTAVYDAIELLRPVCVDLDVPAVSEVTLDVTVDALEVEPGFDSAEVTTNVEEAIEAYIFALETGATSYLTQLGRAIATVAGVRDYTLTTPVANTSPTLDSSTVEVLVPGTVTVNA